MLDDAIRKKRQGRGRDKADWLDESRGVRVGEMAYVQRANIRDLEVRRGQ